MSKHISSNGGFVKKYQTGWNLSTTSIDNVAYDINGYAKAPPSFRVWAGGTVETENIKLLLPWIEWAYNEVKSNYA